MSGESPVSLISGRSMITRALGFRSLPHFTQRQMMSPVCDIKVGWET